MIIGHAAHWQHIGPTFLRRSTSVGTVPGGFRPRPGVRFVDLANRDADSSVPELQVLRALRPA